MNTRMMLTGMTCALALAACSTTSEKAAMTAETAAPAPAAEEAIVEVAETIITEEATTVTETTFATGDIPVTETVTETVTVTETMVEEVIVAEAAPAPVVAEAMIEETTIEVVEEPAQETAAAQPAAPDIQLCIRMGGQVTFRSTADNDFYQVCQMEDGGEIATETLYAVELVNRGEDGMAEFLAQ